MNQLMLLAGYDLPCSTFMVKNPTVKQILDWGMENNIEDPENAYEVGLQIMTAYPYDYMVMLDDMKIDFENIDKFELFKMLYAIHTRQEGESSLDSFFCFILNGDYKFRLYANAEEMVIADVEKKIIITKEIHEELFNLFSLIHGLNDRSNDILFGQKILKKLYIKKSRKKLLDRKAKSKKHTGLLSGKIFPLVKLYNGAITMESIFTLNMYVMTSLLSVGMKKDSYDNVMFGVYTGNVDSKKLDPRTYDWSSI